ncbi:hypothetical protein J8J40_21980, partial [Mycobacterium tuberculosis]|nr:hypothetical protein [Mycobacterium tuberculosis]MBP0649717.1 hypothetical protein [Mycobacterium tuberculosis]
MKPAGRRRQAPSLTTVTFLFVAASAAVIGLAFLVLIGDRMQAVQRDALAEAVTVRGRALQRSFEQTLEQDWRHLRAIAADFASDGTAGLRPKLDLIVGAGERMAWAGYAGLDGQVVTASNGRLLDENVAALPWFSRGLE